MILDFKETTIFSENDQVITIIKNRCNFTPLRGINKVYITEAGFDELCKKLGYSKGGNNSEIY